ncbi:MAG TPA: hypothetical protein VKZ94_18770 [Advenella sp.]|nr:hypothetical protein [Advenella sp.]
MLVSAFGAWSASPWARFLVVNASLFVPGAFLDMAATILIRTPHFPADLHAVWDGPVQFGIVMLLHCA